MRDRSSEMLNFRFRLLAVSYVLVLLLIVAIVLVAAHGIGDFLRDAEPGCDTASQTCQTP